MSQERIPLHSFAKDDHRSISIKVMPLEYREAYDTSVAHRHNYYEIFLFEEGGGFHEIDFQKFEIAPRSIHFVSPGQVHLVRRALNSRGTVIFFSRDFYYLNSQDKNLLFELPFLNNNTSRPILDLDLQTFPQLENLAASISREFGSDNSYREETIRSYLNIFLIECRRHFDARPDPDHQQRKGAFADQTFRSFRVMLEENFMALHQVKDYASLLAITEKHLNELCKKARGKTASEMIYDRIILEAKRLLIHSDMNNKEVAFHLNFDDPSHFSKFFKRKVGVSPSEFRKSVSVE